MAFRTSYNAGLGQPAITLAGVDTVAKVAIGTIIKGYDEVLGEGEFIYLPGLAATIAGDWVVYDLNPAGPATVRLVTATFANTGRSVAVAVAATGAGSYGWYQISGCAIANTIAGTVAGNAYAHATTGQVANTLDAGDQVLGARISTAVGTPAAGQSYVTLNRPFIQGNIT